MKLTDCFWERKNLGENVCEVTVEDGESFDSEPFLDLNSRYTYQVIKLPTGNISFNTGLARLGYFHIETQLNWVKKVRDFDFCNELIVRLEDNLSFKDVISEEDLSLLLNKIDDDMFSTDRIALDPQYGLAIGRIRYCNWIWSEFTNKSSYISFICIEGTPVGFLMLKVNGRKGYGLLGGIFKQYQNMGLGVLTASSFLLYIRVRALDVSSYYTTTSSNNPTNFRIYNKLGFDLSSMTYVYIKHVKPAE